MSTLLCILVRIINFLLYIELQMVMYEAKRKGKILPINCGKTKKSRPNER